MFITAFKKNLYIKHLLPSIGLIVAAGCTPPSSGPPPLISSPSTPEAVGLPAFIEYGVTPTPLAPKINPALNHPYLSNGRNGAHADTNNSDTTDEMGPLTTSLDIVSHKLSPLLLMMCPAMMVDNQGRIQTICITLGASWLYLLDQYTLEILAKRQVPTKTGVNLTGGANDSSGGGYLHVDPEGRMIINQTDKKVVTYEVVGNPGNLHWGVYDSVDFTPYLAAEANINDAVPDWQGRLWINASDGTVGYYDPATQFWAGHTFTEGMQNAVAIDETGVYAVTHGSMNKLVINPTTGAVDVAWSTPYDNSRGQSGLLSAGSGTSPVLYGENSDVVSVADNATQLHLNVYHRTSGVELCSVPIFDSEGETENSPIAYRNSVVVENNGNFDGLFGDPLTVNKGLVKIDVNNVTPTSADCSIAWENYDHQSDTTPQLSTSTGMIYTYSMKRGWGNTVGNYITTVDWTTGLTVSETWVGNGEDYTDNLLMMMIEDDAYIMATLRGIFVARDAQ